MTQPRAGEHESGAEQRLRALGCPRAFVIVEAANDDALAFRSAQGSCWGKLCREAEWPQGDPHYFR